MGTSSSQMVNILEQMVNTWELVVKNGQYIGTNGQYMGTQPLHEDSCDSDMGTESLLDLEHEKLGSLHEDND